MPRPIISEWKDPYKMDSGASSPGVAITSQGLLLVYRLGVQGIERLSSGSTDQNDIWGRILFEHNLLFKFGYPNDEVLNGHPLYKYGLKPYTFHFIDNSPWIDDLERSNKVHPRHTGGWHEKYKHWIVSFHDETLEVLARQSKILDPKPATNQFELLREGMQ